MQAIERGLALYEELVGEDAVLEREFEESRGSFATDGALDDLAARRHLEWFVLERPSEHLGGVPAEMLQHLWEARAGASERELGEAFLHSRAGAYEVTSQDPERGLWVRDLFGMGEFPVSEPDAAARLQDGDLLVGRLFPVGEGLFRLSPAVTVYRSERLLEAVRDDLERMRGMRRGVLRIQQVELERLFFQAETTPDLEAEQERVRSQLAGLGLSAERAATIVARVVAAGEASEVTETLNELAFDTQVDLERARRALIGLWSLIRAGSEAQADASQAPGSDSESTGGARSALEAFDQGRRAGRDLDDLFQELSNELGIDPALDVDDPESAPPDFPGVVGAMVEEFLWDVGREHGKPTAERLAGLRKLAQWGANLGVFENIGRRDLLDFAGRWLLDQGELSGPEEARAVLDALGEFCRWCEERHDHPLWSEFESLWTPLSSSIPRLVAARRSLGAPVPDGARPCDVAAVSDDDLVLIDEDGRELRGSTSAGLRDLLRAGDFVHAALCGEGTLCISACYPGELRELVRPGGDA